MTSWWRSAPASARRALVAAALGWMLDALDVLLYSFVLNDVRREFGLSDRASGLLIALPLASSAVGGALFGWLADRVGRTRALTASIAVYSVATAACGLAQIGGAARAVCRVVLGLGMGGEWATGAALVAETWPAAHRGKALGVMQSAWAIGYAAAAAVNALVLPVWGWRGVFLRGRRAGAAHAVDPAVGRGIARRGSTAGRVTPRGRAAACSSARSAAGRRSWPR